MSADLRHVLSEDLRAGDVVRLWTVGTIVITAIEPYVGPLSADIAAVATLANGRKCSLERGAVWDVVARGIPVSQ